MTTWTWRLSLLARKIWFRATLFSLVAVMTALLAIVVEPFIPADMPTKIGAGAVDSVLGIIASSMLAVTTFSLNVMVSSYSAATSNVTPRATKLVMEDTTTQNVLATFLGSFLFSLAGIITLSTGAYGDRGRVVLFVVTIVVVVLIMVTLLKWIDHLSKLGRVTETTARVEDATRKALDDRRRHPYMGATYLDPNRLPSDGVRTVRSKTIGYVQHLDIAALSEISEQCEGRIYVAAVPGKFVDLETELARTESMPDVYADKILRCFTIGDTRSFDQDPRFGACVLSEIASRALSPGINDPGTAIDVIGRAVRLLSLWSDPADEQIPRFGRVFVPALNPDDLFDDLFNSIARDGAGVVEVGLRLQKAYQSLAQAGDRRCAAAARRHAIKAMEYAQATDIASTDLLRLREAQRLNDAH